MESSAVVVVVVAVVEFLHTSGDCVNTFDLVRASYNPSIHAQNTVKSTDFPNINYLAI